MAASRFSLNSPDLVDLASVMAAFQEINKVVVTLTGRVEFRQGVPYLTFLAQAHDQRSEIGEAPSFASVKSEAGQRGYRTLESAILWSLYQLDAAMAQAEMVEKAEAAKPLPGQ